MKNQIIVLVVIAISFMSNHVFAQNDNGFKFNATIGLPAEVTSGSSTFAINAGLGVEKPLSNKWALEGQLSTAYLTFDRQDGISHDGGFMNYYTLTVGPKFYWNGLDKKHPIYTNFLVGGGQWLQEEYSADNVLTNKNSLTAALGSGTYIAIDKKFIAGLAMDITTGNESGQIFLSAKIGYTF